MAKSAATTAEFAAPKRKFLYSQNNKLRKKIGKIEKCRKEEENG